MFLYIHGFASTGNAFKGKVLGNYFGREKVISPTLPVNPADAMAILEQIVADNSSEELILVGSSLGGFYSIYLSQKYDLKAVLINPVIDWTVMKHVIGVNKNWQTGEEFEFTAAECELLKQFQVEQPNCDNYLVLLQKDDELLDYRKTVDFMPIAQRVVKSGGGHHYNDFAEDMETLGTFIKR